MKILVVGLVENEQMDRLWREGYKRGHNIVGCYSSELVVLAELNNFLPTLRSKKIEDFDLLYFWAPGKKRWDWYATANYLHKKYSMIVVNKKNLGRYNPSILEDLYVQSDSGIDFPKSAVIFSVKSVNSIVGNFKFPVIVKMANGKQGKNVYKVENKKELKEVVAKLEKDTGEAIVIREFIPNDGDIRVFTIGYKAVGAMKRTPKEGEFRSNISQGGTGSKFDLSKYSNIKKLAEKASIAAGVEIAGVDVIIDLRDNKPYILEVNPGPQFMGIEKYTGINIAGKIINYFEELYSKNGKR
ncbi:hypothetical protein A3A76_04555 [Candidatus Woesebacteria bacterium RIFCSPLOWO2_01_FULL_39_23]|uniref:ATP-grasp domain-containing protein n=1 Tax=Candidatus Woesebacteria bacterium RIFCSPHIGHO2_01_FULL_40_22 TaxID=1802499 RepID=A0A1F7YJW7_9BACT|nr:MAG: hypothetical protein A2141_06065 [Candidatus Woesebacteria bacterium RBG_16_40_11]OGM27644.1 MAG: hypothetical protein A2628_04190 [Candidatus Woesebacteria bacterium RIFCSPHIGHO2_01_FULL_40_22]OGM37037.1 MAG: hypothetical protein A3E41_01135 [Candidatus Woesebacteria bacterium RIFCSPHIGHO2_12_FULL_38_9]OGM63472.1 MAG: hypothetical protein A3A76_04555 [Candidatus Woesebacteria bacterium RIFCSPLOWO2_01_FULL_39_23]